jgi:hypothetical protein
MTTITMMNTIMDLVQQQPVLEVHINLPKDFVCVMAGTARLFQFSNISLNILSYLKSDF